ncbi:uroporphyrinogen decarboxylase family protein [Neotabrizicola sp. sgz301269]|uniref:uroporphyrinogen decarboxylase family protein n=1 Tax=Neotabrizicola sp. sgz301269 TaxID=3276282 RepID=UPI00376FA796
MQYSDDIRRVFGTRTGGAPLFSFWSHFPDDDHDADRLAAATIDFQHRFDMAFVKTAPNGMFAVEDLGVEIDTSAVSEGGVAKLSKTPYVAADAWARLPEPDPTRGALARELRALRLVRAALPEVPILFTLFSPMTLASKLSRGRVHDQIAARAGTQTLHEALGRLARGTADLARAAIEAGASGVFFAHQDTGRHLLSYDDFSEFVAPYDIEALLGAQAGGFNLLHVHGERIRFRELSDYPVHALNWHDNETLPSALAGRFSTGKCIVGGIDRWAFTRNDLPALRRQALRVLSGAKGFGDVILAPSCAIRAGFSDDTLTAFCQFLRGLTSAEAIAAAVAAANDPVPEAAA